MATIVKELAFDATPESVWDSVRSVGTPHVDLVPGFVVDCDFDGTSRAVTFVNGAMARELIVSVDESAHRLAYAVVESGLGMEHHHAVMQVTPAGDGARLTWTVDVLPEEAAPRIGEMMAVAAGAMRVHLA